MNLQNLTSSLSLNNGVEIPFLGLGVFKSGKETYHAVRSALDNGYVHIDTAAIYENEEAVGRAVKDSGIPREKLFITTKLWNDDMRRHTVRAAMEKSLRLLSTEYVDLYLVHWPVENEFIPAYNVMEKLYMEKKARAIGVSNFMKHHLETLIPDISTLPAVNQIEIQPFFQNREAAEYTRKKGIAVEAYSPLARGKAVNNDTIIDLSNKYARTSAQIILRWHLQKGNIVIPKSVHEERIRENAAVFDFTLTAEDIAAIDQLDCAKRTGADPDNFHF